MYTQTNTYKMWNTKRIAANTQMEIYKTDNGTRIEQNKGKFATKK